jgi:heat shock protein HtpX
VSDEREGHGQAGTALRGFAWLVGCYGLALAAAAGLLFIPYADWTELHRLRPGVALACLLGAAVILWSVWPVANRFAPPGPALTAAAHPHLFAVIQRAASAAAQAMPAEVYLVRSNAFIAQRGGVMGFASRRVLGIGLPVLQALEVSQLEAVLVHEFGHYHGDVRVALWVLGARRAFERTFEALAKRGLLVRLLHVPFGWCGRMFLAITRATAHQQELAADALAARAIGAGPLAEGMRRVHAAEHAIRIYWSSDVLPVLQAGFRPPLVDGFRRFLAARVPRDMMEAVIAQELAQDGSGPYVSHPSLRRRLSALSEFPELASGVRADQRPAAALLDAAVDMDQPLLQLQAAHPEVAAALVPIAWEDVGDKIFPPVWAAAVDRIRHHLTDVTAGALPGDPMFYVSFARKLLGAQAVGASGEQLVLHGASEIAAAVMLHLRLEGWSVRALPGEPVSLERAGSRWDPAGRLIELASGHGSLVTWRMECADAGVSEVDLGRVGLGDAPRPASSNVY